jgi:hypothetical protein
MVKKIQSKTKPDNTDIDIVEQFNLSYTAGGNKNVIVTLGKRF